MFGRSLSGGRDTFTRARIARVAPAGLPDPDQPAMVASIPERQRDASGYGSCKLLQALELVGSLETIATVRCKHLRMGVSQNHREGGS